ncbi:hypothetical protein ACCO45_008323 [Purpureocillium lilacinum]|uniref:Uncharacterized protein n=1 Tax=Purpureocillium lilacinum TaxID=33203 RepID=A0ACC4DN04_PURLI
MEPPTSGGTDWADGCASIAPISPIADTEPEMGGRSGLPCALPRCAVRALHRDVLLRWLGACSSPDLPALAPVVVVGLGAPGPGGEWTLVAARLPRLDAGLAARRSRHRDRHRGSPRLSIKACPVRRPV